jgi:hypothetical protein
MTETHLSLPDAFSASEHELELAQIPAVKSSLMRSYSPLAASDNRKKYVTTIEYALRKGI